MSHEEKKDGPSEATEAGSVPKKKLNFPNKTKKEISELARDIAMNKVFCSCFMPEHDIKNLLGMVFMPLIFGAYKDVPKEMMDDIGFIYEYYDKAGPRSINGYPIFFSCAAVSKHDAKIIGQKVTKIQKMLKEV